MAEGDEENQNKGNNNVHADEPGKINKVGVAACIAIFIAILVVGGILNANSKDEEDSKSKAIQDVAPTNAPVVVGMDDPTNAPGGGGNGGGGGVFPDPPSMDYSNHYFNRIATFPVCMQLDENCNTDEETVAEIVQATDDGMMLAYTDGKQDSIGFIDISDPSKPQKAGLVNVGGETTSLVIKGKYVAAGVNTSPDFVNPSGTLAVVDMETQAIVANIDMGGQPDSVALSPDKKFMAIAIENERDEDLNDGQIPQAPAGFLQIVDCSADSPSDWTATKVDLTGLEGVLYNSDPEPEFVAINTDNIAVVTLQENNGIVLVDLAKAEVLTSFSAGTATVNNVDVTEEDIIEQNGSVTVPREPDGVTWIGTEYFATADEGDLDGGSRGFTIYDKTGSVVYESGNTMEEMTIRYGHYPDGRSENKGNEPENVLYAEFGSLKLLFVGSERSSMVFVYEVSDVTNPVFRQVLPTGVKPEGKFAIPSRNLLVVAAEEDARGDKMRSAVSIYEISETAPVYPHLVSADGEDGNPIPFSALSGLSFKDGMLYTVEDSFYKQSRMFVIDPSSYPYTVTTEVKISDANDILSAVLDANAAAVIMNDDKTVNLDLEGIEAVDDGFWLVSEGSGTVGDETRPVTTPNLLLKVDAAGVVTQAVTLPQELNNGQLRFGLEGVAVEGDNVVVAFQRAWTGDAEPRLGIYNTASSSWKFVFYPLDAPTSQNGGWVGLSDLASLGNGQFFVLERDNQGLTDAAIKKIYKIDLGDFSMVDGETVTKTFAHDLIPDLLSTGGLVTEKVEGLAVDAEGNVWINNDNDGVDDNSGEQMLMNVGKIGIYFNRISTFPVCMQLDDTCNTDDETVAEIVQATEDGMMLAYTDGKQDAVGFIDISDPYKPKKAGLVNVGGETTSLVIKGKYVAAGVNTSPDFVNPSGTLAVIDMENSAIVANIDMGGQPDSVALSPDKKFMAIAIENERDEDLNDGQIPQAPAGFLQIVDCSAEDPTSWTSIKVDLTGLEGVLYNSDPEPEFVAINTDNIAVVTLQENNGIVLVDLAKAEVLTSFSAGTATVNNVDVTEEDIIEQNGSVTVPREPDGVTWIGTEYFATADEGDLDGGSRGFTIYDKTGSVVYESGNTMEEMTIRYGHYPDGRSENKGNEPENVLYAEYGSFKLLFVGSERSSLVFVYEVSDVTNPVFRQVLPTGVKPEGKFAIPSRNLLVVAAEEDARGDKMRSAVSIYEMGASDPVYPHLVSANGDDGNPIPFSALSGLSFKDGMLYTVEDSFYKQSRMFVIDPSTYPYTVTTEVKISDTNDILSAVLDTNATAAIMNDDKTVNLDLEGIEAVDGGFWLVSEGSGTVGDAARPVKTPNLLLAVDPTGVVTRVVTLPQELNDGQLRFGLEGVAVEGDNVVVAFQRAWAALGDSNPRLGIYDLATDTWKFVFYPLDVPVSQNGGWVGLSDLASLGNGEFLVLERDNQGLADAAIKKIYKIDLGDFSIAEGETVTKTFVHDLIPDLLSTAGLVTEKVEGLAVDSAGNVWVNNDNDGVDDNSGEQLLINIGPLNN